MVAQFGRGVDSVLRVAIIGIENGVTVRVVVRRQLRFNVRQRDISPHPDIRSKAYMRIYRSQVVHDRVIAIDIIALEQLLAEDPLGRCVAVIQAIQVGKPEPPIEMVPLNGIRQTFEVERDLVELNRVGITSYDVSLLAYLPLFDVLALPPMSNQPYILMRPLFPLMACISG